MHKNRGRWRRGVVIIAAAAVALSGVAGCAKNNDNSSGGQSSGAMENKDITIALSNSFVGNTWRQTMVKVFESTAKKAKEDGIIKDYTVNNTAQNTATEQIAQIKALILKKPSAIVINSASGTALDPVIGQACKAGIVVITFDSIANAPCAYKVEPDFDEFGSKAADGVLKAMGNKGNLIVVRGVVGSAPEKLIYDAEMKQIKKQPNVKVVAELQGQASNPITQQAVQRALASLPKIDGVVTGGSTYGALQAFQSAGKPVPPGNFANDGTDISMIKQMLAKDPKYVITSIRPDPGQSALAFWMAIEILKGTKVPLKTTSPNILINNSNFDKWAAVTPPEASAAWQWTQKEAQAAIEAQKQGKPMPNPAIPTKKP